MCRLVPSPYLFNIVKMKLLYEGYMKGCATLDYRAAISGIISQAVLLVPWLITNTFSFVPWEVPPQVSTGSAQAHYSLLALEAKIVRICLGI